MNKKLTVRNNVTTQYIYISEEVCYDDYINIDCPMCDGRGEYEAYNCENDRYYDITCPCCCGDGEVEVQVNYSDYIEEEVEVEEEIFTYGEGCVDENYLYISNSTMEEARENRKEDDILTKLVKGPED